MIGQTISHYRIIEKLGEGGMGVVYKACDTTLDRHVALKFLPSHLSASGEDKARFLQEAKAAAALNHAHICTIHGVEEEGPQMFIVMECVEGGTLREKLPFSKVSDALFIAIQIGEALQEAHSKGVVHRDIKAENIMLTSKGQAKVMDFGLAKLKGSFRLTKTSSTVGTLAYMAPEQMQGGEADERSDIFSFGVLFFEMLTGKTPFHGEHEAAMMYSIMNEEPESVQKGRQDISPDIDRIIHRALEKDPEDRYQHIDDMVSELRRVQKQSTRVSRPTSRGAGGIPSGELFPETHGIDALPAAKDPGESRKRTRKVVGLGIVVVLFLAGFFAYVTFFVGHRSIDTIAVLPFENVGADPNTEYLSDGITESIISSLSQLSNLTVMSRTSVFHYKGKEVDPFKAGNELGVKAVLVGRVTQRGDNLQISAELVDVSSKSQMWGEQYSKTVSDILAVQQDMAKEISRQLRVKLVGEDEQKLAKRATENTEAYQLYLKGRFHWNKRTAEDLQKAIDYYDQAIEKDPGYALAYAGLASTYALLPEYSGLPAREFIAKTGNAAQKALNLDATLAEPHAALGVIKFEYQWDWEGGEKELEQALQLDQNNPTNHHWYSNCLEEQGKLEEALSEIKRAQELDPFSPVIATSMGEVLFHMRRYDLAVKQLHKALELDRNFPAALVALGSLYAQQNKFVEAISELQKVGQILPADNPYGSGVLGYVYAKAGRKADAIKVLNQLLKFSREGGELSVQTAYIYAGLGDKDKAFEWLEKGYNEQNDLLGYLKVDPIWDNLRSDPRYTAMLRKIGLEK